jgi:hypothetical protein
MFPECSRNVPLQVITALKTQVKEARAKLEEEKTKGAKAARSLQMKLTYMNRLNSQQQLQVEELEAKVKALEKQNQKHIVEKKQLMGQAST